MIWNGTRAKQSPKSITNILGVYYKDAVMGFNAEGGQHRMKNNIKWEGEREKLKS